MWFAGGLIVIIQFFDEGECCPNIRANTPYPTECNCNSVGFPTFDEILKVKILKFENAINVQQQLTKKL